MLSPSSVCPVIGGAGLPSSPPSPPGRLSATNARTPAVVTTASAMARRIGRRGVDGLAYWKLATPVMFGWTVQMKVYEPAGIAGTS